ncbi:MAG TPA: nuclear transport factor 2 family protein, partial [Pyrinomonadaceae bacterium]|nr:nuclear transport factor 2 family protein [Pyrinomonadaceae bacterium]
INAGTVVGILFAIFVLCASSIAQAETKDLTQTILSKDALFWSAYNKCDVAAMQSFFTDDVEFYHDKGGATFGITDLMASLRKMCDSRKITNVRREAVTDSVRVFPLKSSNVIYGAIILGQHYFYTQEKGHNERRDGLARFTQLWVPKDGIWKMSRILSFDHGPAPYLSNREAIKLSRNLTRQYTGQFAGRKSNITIRSDKDTLSLVSDNLKMNIYPESKTIFFSKERDLTFEFVKDQKGKVSKIIVRENGEIVEEAVRQK